MERDGQSLAAFYDAPSGQVVRRIIQGRVRALWPSTSGQRILGFGFATPFLRPFLGEAERVVALCPEERRTPPWPGPRSLLGVCESDELPVIEGCFDRILLIHALETSESARQLLRQLWRALAPEGKLLVVVPNRTSLWAQVERSPFARGRPFRRGELQRLLTGAMFKPERTLSALYLPPLASRRLLRTGKGWEKAGQRFWPALAGVHLVEASKSLFAPVAIPVGKKEHALAHI